MTATGVTLPSSTTSAGPPVSVARGRRALLGSLTMAAGSGTSYLVSALVVPLTIGYLGAEQFGVLTAAVAILVLCEPLDLGLGSALVTVLAASSADGDVRRDVAFVRAALRGLLVLGVVLGVGVAIVLTTVDAEALLNAPHATGTARTLAVVLVAFVIGLPLALVDRVNLGYQDGARVGRTTLAGNAISLVLVAVAAESEAGVPVLAAALVGGPLIARSFAGWSLLRRRPELRSRPDVPPGTSRPLWRTAPLFFGLQLAVAVGFTSDQFVIAHVLGPEAVTRYAVPARVFAIVSAAVTVLVRPLWPAVAEAASSGDAAWVRRVAARSIAGAAVFASLVSASLVAAGPGIVSLLGRGEVEATRGSLAVFALWSVLAAVGAAVAMVLNGLAVVGVQLVLSGAMAVANLVLSIVLAGRYGVTGVLWASVCTYGALVVLPYAILLSRIIEQRTAVLR